jgi:hypothetical protein
VTQHVIQKNLKEGNSGILLIKYKGIFICRKGIISLDRSSYGPRNPSADDSTGENSRANQGEDISYCSIRGRQLSKQCSLQTLLSGHGADVKRVS